MKKEFNFKFSFFGKKVQMFNSGNMGIVVEKEAQVVCVYATDAANSKIYCALPLCHPKYIKGMVFRGAFYENNTATVSVGDFRGYFDFNAMKCANNKGLQVYGSDEWGRDIAMPWQDELETGEGSAYGE